MSNQVNRKRLLFAAGIAVFGLVCFAAGFWCDTLLHQGNDDEKDVSYDVFSEVTFEGIKEVSDIPWNYTAGIFDMEQGECILLTPNTEVSLEWNEDLPSWAFQYKIHPWVCEGSDGAGLTVWILDEDENILYSDEISVNAENDWVDYFVDLNPYDTAFKIKILCNNGPADNDECDWIILKARDDKSLSFSDNYVRSATYFADEWPLNFWNSEMDCLEKDLGQIKADGFDSIIIVIPWREFQPTISPVTYNEYAFMNLDKLMTQAEDIGLKVYARIGYTWDFYDDQNENIVDRFFTLLGDADALAAWDAYVLEMYHALTSYDCFAEAFLTWEDFWNSLEVCNVQDIDERIEKARYIGYGEWVQEHYSLDDYNQKYHTEYTTYDEIPIPYRSDPALWAMYEYYDDFLYNILKRSQQYFPNLSMEVRMDWDIVTDKSGAPIYYKHNKTYTCANADFSTTMYGIPMGFENKGERVTYQEALEKTKYILENFKTEVGGKAVYIDQFIFADNTPKFAQNAQINEGEIGEYLLNVAEILRNYSEGYGIWTYRNYRSNMLYNPQFALGEKGWNGQNIDFQKSEESMVCHIFPTGSLSQTIPDLRNHFEAKEYLFEFDIVELKVPGILEIQIGDNLLEIDVANTGRIQLAINDPICFDLSITSIDADVVIDNLNFYNQIQQGYLYDENSYELECIAEIRELNKLLELN